MYLLVSCFVKGVVEMWTQERVVTAGGCKLFQQHTPWG
jgi:hypothetical protein